MSKVYLHRTINTNEIFYVGISHTKSRPYSKFQRNKFWHAIVHKHGFIVEILHDDLTWKEAQQKEVELINKYGRRDLGTGILVNMTIGGEGAIGRKDTPEELERKSKVMFGNKYALGSKRTNDEKEHLSELLQGNKNSLGYEFTVEQKEHLAKAHYKTINQLDSEGNFIRTWPSVKEAGETLSIHRGTLSTCLKGKYKTAGGYIWQYA